MGDDTNDDYVRSTVLIYVKSNMVENDDKNEYR